jgi:quercetin dioxygenase-like cupin family protein
MQNEKSLEERIRQTSVNWEKEIAIQPDGIVSKTLIEKKSGTITVFSFDKNQALSEHSAPFDAYVHILTGQMDISLNGEPHPVHSGESLIMPANVPHALKAAEASRMLLVMIRS